MNIPLFFYSLRHALSREIKMSLGAEFILNTAVMPLLYVGLFGPLMEKLVPSVTFMGQELGYLAFMLPGIIAMTCFMVGMRGGTSFLIEKRGGGLETMFSLPIPRFSLFLAKVFATCIQGVLAITMVLSLGVFLAEGISISLFGLIGLYLIAVCIIIAITSIMIFLMSITKNPTTPLALGALLLMPLMMLSTVFYPENVFEDISVIGTLVQINPISHASDIIRSLVLTSNISRGDMLSSAIYLSSAMIIGSVIGYFGFNKTLDR